MADIIHIFGMGIGLSPASTRWVIVDGFGLPATGSTYTLAAGQGTYTLTGEAVGLLAQRRLTASQGSYALTGEAVNLIKGYIMSASQGSYSLTGQIANLLVGRKLLASQGSYSLTGQSANLLKGYLLGLAQGSYVLNGQPANLRFFKLSAVFGAYTLTGKDVSFIIFPPRFGHATLTISDVLIGGHAFLIETPATVRAFIADATLNTGASTLLSLAGGRIYTAEQNSTPTASIKDIPGG